MAFPHRLRRDDAEVLVNLNARVLKHPARAPAVPARVPARAPGAPRL